MYKVSAKIEGIAPLFQNPFFIDQVSDTGDGEGTVSKSQRKSGETTRSPENEAAEKLIKLDDGRIGQPAIHIRTAMIKAASDFKIPGKGNKKYSELFRSCVFVEPEIIPHNIQSYAVDVRRAVIRATRAAIPRSRPRLDEWSLDFTISVVDDQIPFDIVKKVLELAGAVKGIGDYRPDFGRFKVTKFEKV